MNEPAGSPVYLLMLAAGIAIGAYGWRHMARADNRLPLIYFAGLVGAFLGAKLAYLAAEGWLRIGEPEAWRYWLAGKSVTGALPGGWLGVEAAKRVTGYRAATGDRFALLLPVPLILGRFGCLHAACCPGLPTDHGRWPAVPVEIAFQVVALAGLLSLRRWQLLPGQHFHLYLVAYGLFRFTHEFLRATPKPFAGLSGYQWIALATAVAAAIAFRHRARIPPLPPCKLPGPVKNPGGAPLETTAPEP